MTGFVAIGAGSGEPPVSSDELDPLIEAMAFRGPAASGRFVQSVVGLGHTLPQPAATVAPLTLDGRHRIVAEVRIDDRETLLAELGPGPQTVERPSDEALLLMAYDKWGQDCVEHLLGDFSFALWDEPRQLLFAARDHFGIRPLYHGMTGGHLIVSNTLSCLQHHPGLGDRLDERAIGDLLLLGYNHDETTTFHTDIRALPPGHTLLWKPDWARPRSTRYWSLPVDDPIRYRRPEQYIEHMIDVFDRAVADRLPTDRAAVLMSGGMDSTAIAASAVASTGAGRATAEIAAVTSTPAHLFSMAEELSAAQDAAAFIGIGLETITWDHRLPFEDWGAPELLLPDPTLSKPAARATRDRLERATKFSPVVLTGYGGDPLQTPEATHFVDLLLAGQVSAAVRDVGHHLAVDRDLPRTSFPWIGLPPTGLRSSLRRLPGLARTVDIPWPAWINPDFAARINLAQRRRQLQADAVSADHPRRSLAARLSTGPYWPNHTLRLDSPESLRAPVDVRHPFFDLRLVSFLLAIPSYPWCDGKHLLRLAMADRLPDSVLQRPKAGLRNNNYMRAAARRSGTGWADALTDNSDLDPYVDRPTLKAAVATIAERSSRDVWVIGPTLNLSSWLRNHRTLAASADWP